MCSHTNVPLAKRSVTRNTSTEKSETDGRRGNRQMEKRDQQKAWRQQILEVQTWKKVRDWQEPLCGTPCFFEERVMVDMRVVCPQDVQDNVYIPNGFSSSIFFTSVWTSILHSITNSGLREDKISAGIDRGFFLPP